MPVRDKTWQAPRTADGRFVETFELRSARIGTRLAARGSSSAQERAAYSKEVVKDGQAIARYVIEKHTRKSD
jgi:hypothetical protein